MFASYLNVLFSDFNLITSFDRAPNQVFSDVTLLSTLSSSLDEVNSDSYTSLRRLLLSTYTLCNGPGGKDDYGKTGCSSPG